MIKRGKNPTLVIKYLKYNYKKFKNFIKNLESILKLKILVELKLEKSKISQISQKKLQNNNKICFQKFIALNGVYKTTSLNDESATCEVSKHIY
jgi:hypothetical protein